LFEPFFVAEASTGRAPKTTMWCAIMSSQKIGPQLLGQEGQILRRVRSKPATACCRHRLVGEANRGQHVRRRPSPIMYPALVRFGTVVISTVIDKRRSNPSRHERKNGCFVASLLAKTNVVPRTLTQISYAIRQLGVDSYGFWRVLAAAARTQIYFSRWEVEE